MKLENGVTFVIPSSSQYEFENTEIPSEAELAADNLLKRFRGRSITKVHRLMIDEDEPDGEPVILEFDNKYYLVHTPVAPHGTGEAGYWIYTEDQFEEFFAKKCQDFWL